MPPFRSRSRKTGKTSPSSTCIGIIGLGYVGLPLAVEFGKKFTTVGFDINKARVSELGRSKDSTLEVEPRELKSAKKLRFATNPNHLKKCTVFIVTVPTPIDANNRPDLGPIVAASRTVGSVLKKNDVAIFAGVRVKGFCSIGISAGVGGGR